MRTPIACSGCQAFLAVALVVANPVAAADDLATRRAGPHVLGPLSSSLQSRLEAAFEVALERLVSRPACRALYQGLAQTGQESLAVTRYVRPTLDERRRICSRRNAAFTVPGGRVTRLCASFSMLSTPRAAAVLLHEALHTAGLPEYPQTAGAPRSSEINERVARHCEL